VREALLEPISTIVDSVRITLERCPPEFRPTWSIAGSSWPVVARLLRGFDKLLSEETGLPVHVAEDPLSAVAEGTGKCLNELKFLRQVASADRSGANNSGVQTFGSIAKFDLRTLGLR
jgi:rod shape-determining protein MreB